MTADAAKPGSISGMTGFGRADGRLASDTLGDWSWTVEARSVNGRTLEMRFRGPTRFEMLERVTKALAQARLTRGQVAVNVQARRTDAEGEVHINEAVLSRYMLQARSLEKRGAQAATADGLLALKGVLGAPEDDDNPEAWALLEEAMTASIDQALTALKDSRDEEGQRLLPIIVGFVDQIEALVKRTEGEAVTQADAIRERFTRRMSELVPAAITAGLAGYEDRLVLEAAALATKADVREELDRLTAHVASARTLLGQPPAGRKLDFLMQEFMREANTLCSKSATTALTAIGLDLKAVIEQMREQVQNVE